MPILGLLLLILSNACLDIGFCEEFSDGLYALLSPDQHEETPRLEDFFWTGSGDGPPPPSEAPATPVQPSKPVVRTTTVLATVYLDSYPPQAVTDKTTGECVSNCGDPIDPGLPGSLEPDIPEDRRYWLLTVIQGSTPQSLQLKLARLYQKAFLRQQERHLGIIKSLDAPTARKKHDVHSFAVSKDNNMKDSNPNVPDESSHSSTILKPFEINKPSIYNDIEVLKISNDTNLDLKETNLKDVETWVLVTPTTVLKKREVTNEVSSNTSNKEELIDIPLEPDSGNETLLFKREIIKPEQQPPVHVHIQNITESPDTGSVQIVYVVLVGGRAVPAAVAARDMRLVRDAEVARELGAVVTTKAEPYLKAAEGLAGEAVTPGIVQGAELWALVIGAAIAFIILLLLLLLVCRLVRRKKAMSAASLRAYRNELIREVERNQLKQVHEEKDGKLISVVSPSRTRPSSTLLPVYRASSASSSSTSSGVSEMAAAFNRRRQKKPHALRMPQKKRVGTTDSLLEAAGIDSSDSAKELSAPATPTSYLSMPSVRSFPRGNTVEPLSRVLEPISVRHLDIDSPSDTPKEKVRSDTKKEREAIPRRQMASQLVRLGSIDKDPGVIGPLVWDLHCQSIKDVPKQTSPPQSTTSSRKDAGVSRMRQRFNELMDDAFSLFGSPASSPKAGGSKFDGKDKGPELTQARNDNVRLPGSPYTALDTVRGRSAGVRPGTSRPDADLRPRTSFTRVPVQERRQAPARAWESTTHPTSRLPPAPLVNPALILAEGRLPPEDPALPLISAIKSEIQRVREHATGPNQ